MTSRTVADIQIQGLMIRFENLLPLFAKCCERSLYVLSPVTKNKKSSVFILSLLQESPASFTTAVAVGMVTGARTGTSASTPYEETVATDPDVS